MAATEEMTAMATTALSAMVAMASTVLRAGMAEMAPMAATEGTVAMAVTAGNEGEGKGCQQWQGRWQQQLQQLQRQ